MSSMAKDFVRPKTKPLLHLLHLDECASGLYDPLLREGFDVTSVSTEGCKWLRGKTDPRHINYAHRTRRLIITSDKGFRSHCQKRKHCGALILPSNQSSPSNLNKILKTAKMIWSALPKQRSTSDWPNAANGSYSNGKHQTKQNRKQSRKAKVFHLNLSLELYAEDVEIESVLQDITRAVSPFGNVSRN